LRLREMRFANDLSGHFAHPLGESSAILMALRDMLESRDQETTGNVTKPGLRLLFRAPPAMVQSHL
jgi:hypothetical protein